MIFQPAIIALLLASLVTTAMVGAAAVFGLQVVRRWDIASGSEAQLRMERRTYLISTLLAFAFAVEIASLLLFVFNADRMHSQFVGAMCAVGTLNANAWGFPTVELKIVNFLLGGVWLVLNHVDNRGYDYPLIRVKYGLLLFIAPSLAAETSVQAAYFLNLKADVITSCCGSLFSSDAKSVAAETAALPPGPAMAGFYSILALTLAAGLAFLRWRRGALAFAGLAGINFLAALAAVISFISLYIYEHPHHHCPFDVIQSGYHYIGYGLYLPLFAATVLGLGVGAVAPFGGVASLAAVVPEVTRRLTATAVLLLALFGGVATYAVLASNLILFE
ncbi:MAG: hypothetical protein H7841_07185 [Magnetospirillum sp. WYHS-4]